VREQSGGREARSDSRRQARTLNLVVLCKPLVKDATI